MTSLLMYKLLIQVGEYKNHTVRLGGMTPHEKYEKLHPVLAMMQERYREDLSLTDMAEVIGVTTNHLCRLFREETGFTVGEYILQQRLLLAAALLTVGMTACRLNDNEGKGTSAETEPLAEETTATETEDDATVAETETEITLKERLKKQVSLLLLEM